MTRFTPNSKHALAISIAACAAVFAQSSVAQAALPAPVMQGSPAAKPDRPDRQNSEQQNLFRALWQNADTDKDGQISRTEAQAAKLTPILNNFDAIDSNKDGKITEAELSQWQRASRKSAMDKEGGQRLPPPASGAVPPPPSGVTEPSRGDNPRMNFRSPEQRQAEMQERFNKADTNKDGGLSREEIQAAGMPKFLLDSFDRIDTNKDSKITQDEMRAAWQRDHKPAQ